MRNPTAKSTAKFVGARPMCTGHMRALVRHCETLSLKLARDLQGPKPSPALIAKLAQIVLMINQLCAAIRLNEVFNHNLRIIARVKTDPVFRAHVRATIGESAIKTWWRQYHAQDSVRSRRANRRSRHATRPSRVWRQSDDEWKPYALHPFPKDMASPVLSSKRIYAGVREKRLFPPALFFPWQLDARPAPDGAGGPRAKHKGRDINGQDMNSATPKAPPNAPRTFFRRGADPPAR